MEMKVRFRLLNDETLHCSTEIKKSSCTFNVSFPQDNVHYPHCSHGESCSEAEDLSVSDTDDVFITRLCQKHLKKPHCQHCCVHCQEYDIWKNPAFSEQEALRHIGSASSSASSCKIKCNKESVGSVHTTSCEEYTEQVVEKATCIQRTVGEGDEGDNKVQYCTISRCCSRSEVCSVSTKAKKADYTDENYGRNDSTQSFDIEKKRPSKDQMGFQIAQASVETNSSDILAFLKEDEDKEETDLSPSNFRASQNNKENDEQTRNTVVSPYSFTPCKPPESPKQLLSTRTSSRASCCSVTSKTSRKVVVTETENVDHDKNNTPLSSPHKCQHKELTDNIENSTPEAKLEAISQLEAVLDEDDVLATESDMRALNSKSNLSKPSDDISDDRVETFQTNEKERYNAMVTKLNPPTVLTMSSTCFVAEQEFVNAKGVEPAAEEENIEGTPHATSANSNTSSGAKNKTKEPADIIYEEEVSSAELQKSERAQSVMSVQSNTSTISKLSTVSEPLANEIEIQTEAVMSRPLSKVSSLSQISDLETSELTEMEDQINDRSSSIMSVESSNSEATLVKLVKVQSAESLASALSTKTNISAQSIPSKISEGTPIDMDNRLLMERVPSGMSAKSDVSVRSKTSNILHINPIEDHAPSAKSNKSNTSSRSNTPMISLTAPKEADNVEEVKKERLKRPSSNVSLQSATSVRSAKYKQRDDKDDDIEKTKQLQDKDISSVIPSKPSDLELSEKSTTSETTMNKYGDAEDHSEEQATSTMSTKSNRSEMLETGMGEREERPLSARSSKSSVSKKSKKSKLSEAECECDHPGDRPVSIMSSFSVKSKKSDISNASFENEEEEETKQTDRRSENALSVRSERSRRSKASEPSRQNTGDEGNREGSPSTMSCKSILSDRSNLAPDRVDNTESTELLLKETESAYEETKDDRTASAMSSKSQLSSLSNKSKDQTQERTPTSMSAKSNFSTKSKNLRRDQSPSSNKSARSKMTESLAVLAPADLENLSAENTPSAMSVKSNTSNTSKTSNKDCFKEPKKTNGEELVERSPSAVSVKSDTSLRSKGSAKQSNSPTTSTSAKNEKSNYSICHVDPNAAKSKETQNLKIEERAPSDMSAKSSVSSRSVKSNISTLAGRQTDTASLNEKPYSGLSGLKISMTENSNNADKEEKASSVLSKKSKTSSVHQTSERVLTPASASVSIGIMEEYDVDNAEEDNSVSLVSANSIPDLNSKIGVCRKDSSKISENENQQCMQTQDDAPKISLTTGTIVSDISKKSKCTCKNFSQPTTDNVATNKPAKKNVKKSSKHSTNNRSACTDFGSPKTKDKNSISTISDSSKINMSNTLLHFEVNRRSKSKTSSERYPKKDEENISRPHSADVLITSVLPDNSHFKQKSKELAGYYNHRSTPLNDEASKLNTTKDLNVCGRTCNGYLVATDCCKNINDHKSEKNSNSSCRHSSSSLAQEVDDNPSELVPSILPISSPTEVVNEWLKKIPLDSVLYDVGDEFHENYEEEELLKESAHLTQCESGNGSKEDANAATLRPENEQQGVEKIENNESKLGKVKKTAKKPCTFSDVSSSVQLMRILLSPKLDRCNSLPEVSPVYGRKLSTSARGFLDSLVNLQLLDFDPNDVNGKAEKYNDLMNMLQSLWLCDPSDRGKITQKNKFNNKQSNDEECNVKSSSGVDIKSSSQDSGKCSVNEITVAQKSQLNTKGEVIEKKGQEIDTTVKAIKRKETNSDSATPDIASRVRWTPENEAEKNIKDSNILSAVPDFTIGNNYSPREPPDTASISNTSSGHDRNVNQKLTDHEEDTHSESLSSEQMVYLTEKVSQDPDPVWVLNLLNKIERQFMTHYVTAMSEFKIRWNLNDNEQLDVMICELRDEVHKRIQASIDTELRKIQGHASRPRPPKETMSRESSILTEQRRRRLKVNLNQSIDLAAKTDYDYTAILMTDFIDQQNDDEYCPCDTCMKKKMFSRPVLPVEVSNSAPLMTEFDLRNILHLKMKAPSNSKENLKENEDQHIDVENLAENILLESLKKNKMQELYKANLDLEVKSIESTRTSSIEQNESNTSNDKGFEKECSQAVEKSNPQGLRKEGSSSSLGKDASDTHPNKFQLKLKIDQPGKGKNNTFWTLDQESPIADDELRDHVQLRNEILEMTNEDVTDEEEDAQSLSAHMETEAKITENEEEICPEMPEQKESAKGEPVREEHTMEAETAKENVAINAVTVGEQEVAKEVSTEGKMTSDETSDDETGDWTVEGKSLDEKESLGERTEDSEAVEGEMSEFEAEEAEEILDAEKEKHEGTNTETIWKNMLARSDIEVESETTEGEGAEKEIATATEEPKIKSKAAEDEKEAKHKSKRIENGTNEEDDSVEADKSGSTDNGGRDANESAEENEAIKKLSKDIGKDKEKISEPVEDGDTTEHESAKDNLMNNESANEGETDNNELDAEAITTKAETAADEKPADNKTAEYRENFDDDPSDRSEISEAEETDNNVTTEDEDTIGVKAADFGGMCKAKTAEDNDYENSETSRAQSAEDPSDDRETPEAKGEEISDNGIVYDGEANDAGRDAAEKAKDGNTDDEEISETKQMPCNETADSGITTKDKTTEYEESHNDGTSDDDEAVVADDEEMAEAAENNRNIDNDDRAEEPERAKMEEAENKVDSEIVQDREENGLETESEARDNANDPEMDISHGEDDGEATNDEAHNREIADEGTTEDGQTPNDTTSDDGTAEDEKTSESDMEKVDETTEAETEEKKVKNDGRADGHVDDDEVTDDEATTGTENEENEKTAEANTGEDGETADNETTEDEDTTDERKVEGNIAQNGEIVEEITEGYGQTDDSEHLENGETAGEVDAETHKSSPAEAVINQYNIKKQNKSRNQETVTFKRNRYNVNAPSVNNGESEEGEDEAENETEPIVETNGRPQGMKIPGTQITTVSFDSAVKMYSSSEDGADADGEDSETEVQNKDGSVENEEDY